MSRFRVAKPAGAPPLPGGPFGPGGGGCGMTFEQSVEDFIRALQSTSSLSRVTLGERTDAFAAEVRALFARLGITRIALPVAAMVVWGRPLRP